MFSFTAVAPEETEKERAQSLASMTAPSDASRGTAPSSSAATTITSFQKVVNANSDAASVGSSALDGGGSGGGGRGGKRTARTAFAGDNVCFACDEPRDKSCWCKKHKKAYDIIYKVAFSVKGLKNPEDPLALPEPEAAGMIKGSESWAFVTVFGDEKERRCGFRNATKSIQTVINFCLKFPEGSDGKRTKRNFNVSLTQFLSEDSVFQDQAHVDGAGKLDFELFVARMKSCRNWSPERSTEMWNELKADLDIDRDEGGPKWSKFRLYIPSWLLGTDELQNKKGRMEKMTVSRSSKAQVLAEDEVDVLRSEQARGHLIFICPSFVHLLSLYICSSSCYSSCFSGR